MSSNKAVSMKLCQGKDVLERMNYLYQASHLMALTSKNAIAASYYGNIMVSCAKKAVLRMNPDVKRTVCKSCQSPLIPGETARVRLSSKRMKMVKWTCLVCNTAKKYPTKGEYKLWADQPEALVELFDYTPKPKDVDCSNRLEEIKAFPGPTTTNNLMTDGKTSTEDETFVKPKEENSNCSKKETNVNSFNGNVTKDVETDCDMVLG